jgi:hypothetical protein
MNRKHEQPNDRPVHPRCAKTFSVEFKCTCDEEWRGWDGTGEALDVRIKDEQRLEARTGWGRRGSIGHGPDSDESEPRLDHSSRAPFTDSMAAPSDMRACWKESENLKTIRGDAHWYGDNETREHTQLRMDKLRLYIIERGYWGDCSGAELDRLRARIATNQRVTS